MRATPPPCLPTESGPERAQLLAPHPLLDAKLQQLAQLAGIAPPQLCKSSLERATDALRQPPTAGQLLDAATLAQQLEASLAKHAGTALRTRAAMCLLLLDPPGSDRLAVSLGYARQVLGT